MSALNSRIFWGILLVLGGIFFLLENLGVFPVGNLIWSLLFLVAGLSFLYIVVRDQHKWWAVIPGLVLVSLSATIALGELAPTFSNQYGGALFLAGMGLAFWIIFFLNRTQWWGIIPGGVLFTLAIVSIFDRILPDMQTGGVFFIGLALTFGVLSLISTPDGRLKWALIPAGVLGILGIFLLASATAYLNYIWPVALIVIGLFLFFSRRPTFR